MNRFSVTNAYGTARVRVSGRGFRARYELLTDFWPSEQPRFLDAMERRYRLDEIRRTETGAAIYFFITREQLPTLMEDIEEIFSENYEERYL